MSNGPARFFKNLRRSSQRSLFSYIEHGDVENIHLLLQSRWARKWMLNSTNQYGQTPLCAACAYMGNSNPQIIIGLIDAGAKVNKPGSDGHTPLQKAVFLGNLNVVSILLERGANPNLHKESESPLQYALLHGYSDIASLLLDNGAVFSEALGWAISANDINIFRRLLYNGSDPRKRNESGCTTLHSSAAIGNAEMVSDLLNYRLHSLVNDTGNLIRKTPLQMISCLCYMNNLANRNSDLESCQHTAIAKMLIDAGADVNLIECTEGITPLCTACKHGSLPLVKLYIEHGAKLLLQDSYASNPFKLLSAHSRFGKKIFEYLVQVMFEMETAINIRVLGSTVFTFCVEHGMMDVLNTLLEYNTDVSFWMSKSDILHHPVRICVELKDLTMLQILLEHGADPDVGLAEAWKTFKTLPSERRLKNHNLYRFSQTPLNGCLQSSSSSRERAMRLALANCLLYYGCDPNIPGVYFTPLHGLVENFGSMNPDVITTVKLLVVCGLDIMSEQWLVERLHPGVPLGNQSLRGWLLAHITSPMPLISAILRLFRRLLRQNIVKKVPKLPLPNQLKEFLLLHHIYKPPI